MAETSSPGQSRVLGVDYGSERIGLSLSDPLGIIASPAGSIRNDKLKWDQLREFVKKHDVALAVVGMPLNLKGQKAHKALEVEEFVEALRRETALEVLVWDERFTTSIAQQTLLAMGTRKQERRKDKGRVDSMAAAIILQSFLDSTKHSRSC